VHGRSYGRSYYDKYDDNPDPYTPDDYGHRNSGYRTNNSTQPGYPQTPKDSKHTPLPKSIQWDGNGDTFDDFAKQVEAHMLCTDLGYLLDPEVYEGYLEEGFSYFESPSFKQIDDVHFSHVKKDIKFLYGCLLSGYKYGEHPELIKWKKTANGLQVWHRWKKTYSNLGSDTLKCHT